MLGRVGFFVLLACFVLVEVGPSLVYAQDQGQVQQQPVKPKRRTLFDMLFGRGDDQEEQQAAPVVLPPVVTKPKRKAAPPPPPPKPTIQKAPNATRVAIFGDSMAVDLAAALDRFYSEDPNISIVNQAVGSSGFVRADSFDWDKTAADQVQKNSFDVAVMMIGVNDRQTLKLNGDSLKALTPEWSNAYKLRVSTFVSAIRAANKPLIWVGLPPMSKADFSTAMGQLNGIQQLAAFSGGADFVDIYSRFLDEDGNYSSYGPDLNGARVRMRKDDGIHFSASGADKLTFYVNQSIKLYYHGSGGAGIEIVDALQGTDAGQMVRPPYQGLGQTRLLEVAGAVIPLTQTPKRATELVTADSAAGSSSFELSDLMSAPPGRVDDFGVAANSGWVDFRAATAR
jgi:hypothetical protein